MSKILEPIKLNSSLTLNNRIVMAPMTRCLAQNLIPTDAMVDYYSKRATVGLIITEGVIIRPDAQGHPNVTGIFTAEQIAGWKKVTDKVHENGGKIFVQLWHTGRLSHSCFHHSDVLAPSAVQAQGTVPRARDLHFEIPKAMSEEQLLQLKKDFQQAAINAREAGFDGVEIHGANGYLIDQFLHYSTNQRDDDFGGKAENMARFPLQVIDAIVEAIGSDRTAIRLSPGAYHCIEGSADDRAVFDYLLKEIEKRNIAYVHEGMFNDSQEFDYLGGRVSQYMRAHYSKTLIGCGSYTFDAATQAINNNEFDLIAIGRDLIANPDYIERVTSGTELIKYQMEMLDTLI